MLRTKRDYYESGGERFRPVGPVQTVGGYDETFNLLHDGLGRKTYVHCTAGINRASLTVLGYLTFCQGMELGKALNIIRTCRPQSNPYEVLWGNAPEKMLLSERMEDLYLYANTDGGGCSKEAGGDWRERYG